MSKLDDLILKAPRLALVVGVLAAALIFIIQQQPLSDGCEVEISNFTRQMNGILVSFKDSKKRIQYAQLDFMRDRCREGNSQGTCEDYFKAIKRIADNLLVVSPKCNEKLIEAYPKLNGTLSLGMRIMSLAAWGESPPESIAQRIGWLTEGDLYAFCRSKNKYVELFGAEAYVGFRSSVYREFPDRWSDHISLEQRSELPRPRALKSAENPTGSLLQNDIYERSLFSLRCDLYQ